MILILQIGLGVALGGMLFLLVLAGMELVRDTLKSTSMDIRTDKQIRDDLKNKIYKINDYTTRSKALEAVNNLNVRDAKAVNVILNRIAEIMETQTKEKV